MNVRHGICARLLRRCAQFLRLPMREPFIQVALVEASGVTFPWRPLDENALKVDAKGIRREVLFWPSVRGLHGATHHARELLAEIEAGVYGLDCRGSVIKYEAHNLPCLFKQIERYLDETCVGDWCLIYASALKPPDRYIVIRVVDSIPEQEKPSDS